MKISKDKYFMAAAFLVAFAFFFFAYPYHLMRREQLTLFLCDFQYITGTYRGAGFLARFLSDFAEQFFCFRLAGPLVVAALLTATGTLAYGISRNFAGRKLSLLIAFLFYGWAFLRETETIYMTQYTFATTGYLLCIFAALKFKGAVKKGLSLVVFAALGLWLFGKPYDKDYGKAIGKPDFEYESLIGLDVEASRENWDKVLEISGKNLLFNEACYYYNLATAMKGRLSTRLLSHPQNHANGLFLFINEVTPFSNGAAGEVWYQLGNMTLADQSAMVAMQSSPKHTGARFIKRMAMINLISGEYGAAQKYLGMLNKTIVYHNWAGKMFPENQDEETKRDIAEKRAKLVRKDLVSGSNKYRLLLGELLEANPGNTMAREYLLCHELLSCDLEAFIEDYHPGETNPALYQEAALVWVNIKYSEGTLKEVDMDDYGITDEAIDRLKMFYRFPNRYKNTYWYYFTEAMGE